MNVKYMPEVLEHMKTTGECWVPVLPEGKPLIVRQGLLLELHLSGWWKKDVKTLVAEVPYIYDDVHYCCFPVRNLLEIAQQLHSGASGYFTLTGTHVKWADVKDLTLEQAISFELLSTGAEYHG